MKINKLWVSAFKNWFLFIYNFVDEFRIWNNLQISKRDSHSSVILVGFYFISFQIEDSNKIKL